MAIRSEESAPLTLSFESPTGMYIVGEQILPVISERAGLGFSGGITAGMAGAAFQWSRIRRRGMRERKI